MARVDPRILAALGIGLLIVVLVILTLTSRRDRSGEDRLTDEQAVGRAASGPETRCGSQATYDRVKAELFRQAAEIRKSDQAAFDRLSAYASVRMDRPLMRSHDSGLGTVRCTGRLSLDLPPGLSVVGGRRTLAADIDYVLQPAADGSGDVVMIEGADPIIIPLATLARTAQAPPSALPPLEEAPVGVGVVPPEQPLVEGAEQPTESARPSFDCRYARTRGEVAVCNDERLAALDRQMASQYFQAITTAGPRQRALLTSTRRSFLRYRDQCPSNACIAETYRGRMREIRDIMAGRWRPER